MLIKNQNDLLKLRFIQSKTKKIKYVILNNRSLKTHQYEYTLAQLYMYVLNGHSIKYKYFISRSNLF